MTWGRSTLNWEFKVFGMHVVALSSKFFYSKVGKNDHVTCKFHFPLPTPSLKKVKKKEMNTKIWSENYVGTNVHIVNILKINMFLSCKISKVLVLGDVLV